MQNAKLDLVPLAFDNVIATSGFMSRFSTKTYGLYNVNSYGDSCSGYFFKESENSDVLVTVRANLDSGTTYISNYKFYTDETGTEYTGNKGFVSDYKAVTGHKGGLEGVAGQYSFHYYYDTKNAIHEFVLCTDDSHNSN